MSPADRFHNLTPLQRAYLAIEEMRGRLDGIENARHEPIAIIGIGCRFPGGSNGPPRFWDLLRDGVDAVTEVPPERWDVDLYYDPDPSKSGKMCTRWGGFLDEVDRFDAGFFGISPREAELMDPQHRVLLETAWEAIEDAGQPAHKLAGSRTGVFVGIYNTDYQQFQSNDEIYAALGNSVGVAAGRLSYAFDLRGPSMLVDTLCSSSLVAVALACQSLRLRDCNLALAGGVNLTLSPLSTIMMSRLQALAPDGRCKTFDAKANGFVRSEGCGIVVLKRLSDALADGDPVWAVVRGVAVNQDGRSTGLTAPNVLAQQEVIRQALDDGRIDPGDVGHIEAHGTGTALGDPIEIEALRALYGQARPDGLPCRITSVKTNFGHAEAAAGVAGLIKSALLLKHELVPPHLHLKRLNPRIDLNGSQFQIPTSAQPWPRGERRRLAAVSSFGLTGTNAHIILEEAPAPPDAPPLAVGPYVLPVSARSESALAALAGDYGDLLMTSVDLRDVCYTASLRRSHHEERLAAVGATAEEIRASLATAARNRVAPGHRPKIAFIFTGHGGQYPGMARSLLASDLEFRRVVEACDAAFLRYLDVSLLGLLESDAAAWVDDVRLAQPGLFAIQVGLAALWRHWGIVPDAVAGHSLGEIAAAHVAGILSLDDAARIVARRSAILKRLDKQWGALIAELSDHDAKQAIADLPGLSIAARNDPRSTLIAGRSDELQQLSRRLEERGVFCRTVKMNFPPHTPLIDPLLPELIEAVSGIGPRSGQTPLYSTVTGGAQPGTGCTADYWARNLRQPVEFQRCIESLIADGHRLFLELGPHPMLGASIDATLASLPAQGWALGSLRRGEPDVTELYRSLAALYTHGQPVDWAALYPNSGRHTTLPAYPWQRERHWIEASEQRWLPTASPGLLGDHREFSGRPGAHLWDIDLGLEALPYLADHLVDGAVVVPGAFYCATALQATTEAFGSAAALSDVQLRQLLVVPEQGRIPLQLVVTRTAPGKAEFQFSSRAGDAWTAHATGSVEIPLEADEDAPVWDLSAVRARCPERAPGVTFYETLSEAGLSYGPAFRAIDEVWRGRNEALARLNPPPGAIGPNLHPTLMDACFQTLAAAMSAAGEGRPGMYLPIGAASIRRRRRAEGDLWVHAALLEEEPIRGDLRLLNGDGEVVFEAIGFTVQRLAQAASDESGSAFYRLEWVSAPLPESTVESPAGRWLILGNDAAMSEALGGQAERLQGSATFDWPDSPAGLEAVVYLATEPSAAPGAALAECSRLLEIVQRLLRAGLRDLPRLVVATRGAQSIRDDDPLTSPAQATLWGMARTVALEHPELACRRVDLEPHSIVAEAADQIAQEIRCADSEDQLAWRDGERQAARLRNWSLAAERRLVPAGDAAFRIEMDEPGILDHLKLREAPRNTPGPGEIEIEVRAAGLNFLDVMTAIGLKPGGGAVMLGGECAGVVSAVGKQAGDWKVGDAVVAIAPHAFGRYATTRAIFAASKPETLSFEQAAATPVVFLTARLALLDAGRLQPGERVLIHSASGGTGWAAVQVARRAGAEIFATAGSPEKRDYLSSLGIAHVMDSRSLDFAHQIPRITNGEGVDVVLNSLAGEAIEKGISVLAPYGRFIEIGKRDIYADHKLGLLPFRNNLTYSAVDLAAWAVTRPEALSKLLREVVADLADGHLDPPPLTTFALADAVAAFHKMAQAKHIGKIVLTTTDAAKTMIERSSVAAPIRRDASYLITGGFGGLGLELARWLAEQGAGCLVLSGRRPPEGAAAQRLDGLRSLGTTILTVPSDISDPTQAATLFERIDAEALPLRGVFHAATVIEDATVTRQSASSIANVFAAKVAGAWNLHTLTRARSLDHFVLFASAAGALGSPGQANYGAANAYLDAMALYRRHQGLPALSIDWGPWAEVGLAAQQDNRGARLEAMGLGSWKPAEGFNALRQLMAAGAPHVIAMKFDLRHWRQVLPAAAGLPLYAELLEALEDRVAAQPRTATLRAELDAEAPAARIALLERRLAEQIAQVLRTSPDRVSKDTPFNSLGIDSLMGLELRNRLERNLGAKLPATLVWSHPTIATLAPHLAAQIGLQLEDQPSTPPAPAAEPTEADVDNVSDEDAAGLLAAKLAEIESEYLE